MHPDPLSTCVWRIGIFCCIAMIHISTSINTILSSTFHISVLPNWTYIFCSTFFYSKTGFNLGSSTAFNFNIFVMFSLGHSRSVYCTLNKMFLWEVWLVFPRLCITNLCSPSTTVYPFQGVTSRGIWCPSAHHLCSSHWSRS